MELEESFRTLIDAARQKYGQAQKDWEVYFSAGQPDRVNEILERMGELAWMIKELERLQDRFVILVPENGEVPIAVRLQNGGQRTPEGMHTPTERYWLPLLWALVEKGGRGSTASIIDRVGELMESLLNYSDRRIMAGRNEPYWRNRTAWVRNTLVNEGYLSDQGPHGFWEITESGKEYLKNRI